MRRLELDLLDRLGEVVAEVLQHVGRERLGTVADVVRAGGGDVGDIGEHVRLDFGGVLDRRLGEQLQERLVLGDDQIVRGADLSLRQLRHDCCLLVDDEETIPRFRGTVNRSPQPHLRPGLDELRVDHVEDDRPEEEQADEPEHQQHRTGSRVDDRVVRPPRANDEDQEHREDQVQNRDPHRRLLRVEHLELQRRRQLEAPCVGRVAFQLPVLDVVLAVAVRLLDDHLQLAPGLRADEDTAFVGGILVYLAEHRVAATERQHARFRRVRPVWVTHQLARAVMGKHWLLRG